MAEPKVRFRRDDGSSYPAWKNVALNDITKRITRKNTNGETNRPLTIASIEGLVDQRTYFGKTIASKDMSGYFLLKRGEYAYNKSYSVGYDYGSIKRLDKYDMGALSTLYICFALNEDQNTDFYDCYFNGLSWYGQMPKICAEGARNHGLLNVSPNDFFKIQLSVPSNKEEQQKIADFLSSVDDVISTSEQEVANLETQKKAVMKKIFSKEVRFKRADGSNYPEWEEKTIGDVTDSLTGYAFESELFTEKGIRLLRGMNIKRGELDFSEDICKYWPTSEGLEKFLLQENDLIVQMDGALVGKSFGLVKAEHLPALLVQRVTRLRGDSTIIQLLYQILSTGEFDKDMKLNQTSTAVPHISLKDITGYGICIPSDPEEQHLIADYLSDFDEAIAAAKKELELWKELKKGLLQQMFV